MIIEPWKSKDQRDLEKLQSQFKTCGEAEEKALVDFDNGIYISINGGPTFYEERAIYLAKKYHIKTLFAGCVYSKELGCYDEKMRLLLFSKFGIDALYPNLNDCTFTE